MFPNLIPQPRDKQANLKSKNSLSTIGLKSLAEGAARWQLAFVQKDLKKLTSFLGWLLSRLSKEWKTPEWACLRQQKHEQEKTHAHLPLSSQYHTRYDLYQLYTECKNHKWSRKCMVDIPKECNQGAEADSDRCPHLTLNSHGFKPEVASKLLQLTWTLQEGKRLLQLPVGLAVYMSSIINSIRSNWLLMENFYWLLLDEVPEMPCNAAKGLPAVPRLQTPPYGLPVGT